MLRSISPQFLRFCMVGGIAFCVDYGLMELLIAGHVSTMVSRGFSMVAALQVSYLLHGSFTFKHSQRRSWRHWQSFMFSYAIGILINYLIFVSLLHISPYTEASISRFVALAVATSVSLIFNYWATKRFVFTARKP
jgi:putative flippase GtrA